VTRLLLRFGPAVIALVFIGMSWVSWNFGDPPTHTVFGPRAETAVVRSGVERYRIGNGTYRNDPVVAVIWPPGSGTELALKGLIPEFFSYGPTEAARIASGFVAGDAATVKVYEGAPYADQFRWFGMVHAVFISLMSLVLVFIAWLFWRIMGPAQATR
jgi:hypothetical protein